MRTSTIATTLIAAASLAPAFATSAPQWEPEARAGAAPSLSASVQTAAQIGKLSNAAITFARTFFDIERRELTPEDEAVLMSLLSSAPLEARAGAAPSLSSSLQTAAQIGKISNAAVTLARKLFGVEKRELTPEDEAVLLTLLGSSRLEARAGAAPSLSASLQTAAQIGKISNAAVTLARKLFGVERRELTPEDEEVLMTLLSSATLEARAGAAPSLGASLQTAAQIGKISNAVVTLARKLFDIEKREVSPETLRILLSGAPIAALD